MYEEKSVFQSTKENAQRIIYSFVVERWNKDWSKMSKSAPIKEDYNGEVTNTTLYYYNEKHIASWCNGRLIIFTDVIN